MEFKLADDSMDLSAVTLSSAEETEKGYVCNICNYETDYKSNLKRHMKVHRDTSKTSTPKSKEKTRGEVSKPSHLFCDQCGKKYKTRYGLSLHTKKHEQQFKHTCTVCHKGYNQTVQFRFHCNMHQKLSSTKCSFCKKEFKGHSSLKRHEIVCVMNPNGKESGKYTCDKCFKAFASNDSLACHRRGKHGPPRYVCEKCGKPFSWRSSLKVHTSSCG